MPQDELCHIPSFEGIIKPAKKSNQRIVRFAAADGGFAGGQGRTGTELFSL